MKTFVCIDILRAQHPEWTAAQLHAYVQGCKQSGIAVWVRERKAATPEQIAKACGVRSKELATA